LLYQSLLFQVEPFFPEQPEAGISDTFIEENHLNYIQVGKIKNSLKLLLRVQPI
jgi:hypothetical protein